MRKDKRVLLILCVFCILFLCTLTSTGCATKDKEFIAEGETTLIENPTKDPSAYTANQQLYILAWQLKNVKSYRSVVVGETESKMPRYVQHINDIHIKSGEESYSEAKSTSFLVNVGKQAFFKGDKVVCREATDVTDNAWSDELNVTTLEEYRSKIGNEATSLTHYILNDETIVKAESKKLPNGDYQITASIDPVKGTSRYKVKMMNYGGLKGEPEMLACDFTLTFTQDWLPLTLVSIDDYKIDKGILNLHCVSQLTETFSDFNKDLTIPNGEKFRNKINEDASDLNENTEVEGKELLFNTILQMDTANGIKINGTLDASLNGQNLLLPIDGWLAFDFNSYPNEGDLNQAFTGRVTTYINNMPINIYYIGDNYLYINIENTKYKYLLTEDENSKSDMNDLLTQIVIEEAPREDNFRRFTISLTPIVITALNKVIADFTSKLPSNFEGLNELQIKNLQMGVTLIKKNPSTARITEVIIDGDFTIAKGLAKVLVAEHKEVLPTAEDLSDYIEGDWNNLMGNVEFIGKIMNGFNHHDFANGQSFNLNLGLMSDGTPASNLVFTFAMLASSSKGVRVNLNFGLGALMGLPGEIFYENGKIYLVTTVNEGTTVYASKVEVIDLVKELANLLPSLQGQTLPNVSIVSVLADLFLTSKVETTTLEDGTERLELYLNEQAVKVIDKLYNQLIQKAKGMDMGPMGPLVGQLLQLFELKLDDVIIRTEYKDGAITSFSLRLKENENLLVGQGKDASLVIELNTFADAKEGAIDSKFALIPAGLKAMEESKDVRSTFDKIIANGLTHIGPSFEKVLTDAEASYNALSKEAQKTVISYKDFVTIKNEWKKLHDGAVNFIDSLNQIEVLLKETGKEKEIYDLINKMNQIYAKIDNRQIEFIGTFAINRYLEIRKDNEVNYQVKMIMDEIDKLTVENYPTSKAFNDAINKSNTMYLSLLEENRALVTNYDLISEAKKASHLLELNEFNTEMGEYTTKLNGLDKQTPYNTLKAEKNNAEKMNNKYNFLEDEDKLIITNYTEFKKAYDKFYGFIGELYLEAYNEVGGDDKIVSGDECFNKIDKVNKLGYLLNGDQMTLYKDERAKVSEWVKLHREIETKVVIDLINAIGEVEFTEASHEKILAARKAVNAIRKTYFSQITNRNKLQEMEATYVKLSIGDLTVDTVTKENKEVIENARKLYVEATTAYPTQGFYQNGIKNKLAEFNTLLTSMEEKIK